MLLGLLADHYRERHLLEYGFFLRGRSSRSLIVRWLTKRLQPASSMCRHRNRVDFVDGSDCRIQHGDPTAGAAARPLIAMRSSVARDMIAKRKRVPVTTKGGRPTYYCQEFAEQGYELCTLGVTDPYQKGKISFGGRWCL
jgi:hypothetical protein